MEQPHAYTVICEKCLNPFEATDASPSRCPDCLKRKNKVFCPVCKVKHVAGTHAKVCRKQHRWKWFWHNLRIR